MKSKSEITQEYLEFINKRINAIDIFEDALKVKKEVILEMSTGNRGIEEMVEELENIQSVLSSLREDTEACQTVIINNEGNF